MGIAYLRLIVVRDYLVEPDVFEVLLKLMQQPLIGRIDLLGRVVLLVLVHPVSVFPQTGTVDEHAGRVFVEFVQLADDLVEGRHVLHMLAVGRVLQLHHPRREVRLHQHVLRVVHYCVQGCFRFLIQRLKLALFLNLPQELLVPGLPLT